MRAVKRVWEFLTISGRGSSVFARCLSGGRYQVAGQVVSKSIVSGGALLSGGG